jgi:hypothetical protein
VYGKPPDPGTQAKTSRSAAEARILLVLPEAKPTAGAVGLSTGHPLRMVLDFLMNVMMISSTHASLIVEEASLVLGDVQAA